MVEKQPSDGRKKHEYSKEEVRILSQGQQMEGTLCVPEAGTGPYPAVIFFPGMTGTKAKYVPMAEHLAKQGIIGLAVNLRAHGGSEGSMKTLTPKDGYEDVLAVFDYLTARSDVDATRIGVVGSSYGGMLAGLLARDRRIKSIVLRAPAAYTKEMLATTYESLMGSEAGMFHAILNLGACPAVEAIKNFDGSILVIASEKDTIIPLRIPEAYLSAAHASRKELKILKDAPHSLSGAVLNEFADLTQSWFEKTL